MSKRQVTELETLNLSEMSGIAQHVDVEKFGNIDGSNLNILFLERRPNKGRLFGNDGPLVGRCLAAANGLNHVLEPPDPKYWEHLFQRIQVQIVQVQVVQVHFARPSSSSAAV